jgi:hypothetical protein
MDTATPVPGFPADIDADAKTLIEQVMAGKPVDPEVARRVHERAQQIRQEILAKHGVLDVAVELIRETREEA